MMGRRRNLYFLFLTLVLVTIFVALNRDPLIFKLPAFLISLATVVTKLLAVLIHTPAMKDLSTRLSLAESRTESTAQLSLLLQVWLSGGELFLGTMFSSVIVIGKVGAETLLASQPDLLQHKTFKQKLVLITRFLPLVALTAVFRIGSSALIVSHFLLPQALAVYPSLYILGIRFLTMFLTATYICILDGVALLLLSILKPWSRSLRQLTLLQMFRGFQMEKFSLSLWGDLGREGSRGIQLIMATIILLGNSAAVTRVYYSHFQPGGHSTAGAEVVFCQGLIASGMASYLLAIIQLFVLAGNPL